MLLTYPMLYKIERKPLWKVFLNMVEQNQNPLADTGMLLTGTGHKLALRHYFATFTYAKRYKIVFY